MILKCQRCENEWDYKGAKGRAGYPEFVTCSKCLTKVKVVEA